MQQRRAVWFSVSAILSVGFVVVSCSSSEGESTRGGGGEAAGGEAQAPSDGGGDSKSGSTGAGGGEAQAGEGPSGHGGQPSGGQASSDGGTGSGAEGGTDASAGQPSGIEGGAGGLGGAEPGGGAGGEPTSVEVACGSAADCGKNQYCLKPNCETKAKDGVCTAVVRGGSPLCGCSGVTFLNSATAAGSVVRESGMCSGASAMDCSTSACGKGLHCARITSGASCKAKVPALCWQLPEACPVERATYDDCNSTECLGLCEAVRAETTAVAGGAACTLVQP